ncbi:hypothetical protein HMPREF3038_01602 [Akkermansia sp. KLE1797]|nr:hypothetical protein HMPREF3038_01602 [Akkermansia sp. KLE1797]KXU54092.1 hypothetical protein HMPREF3039_01757 [Akkermansia sp. KLE1798]
MGPLSYYLYCLDYFSHCHCQKILYPWQSEGYCRLCLFFVSILDGFLLYSVVNINLIQDFILCKGI